MKHRTWPKEVKWAAADQGGGRARWEVKRALSLLQAPGNLLHQVHAYTNIHGDTPLQTPKIGQERRS